MDKRQLVERAKRGDQEAFADLVNAVIGRLDVVARLILRDPDLARDAVQEGMILAWRDLRSLRDPDRFDAWVHRLTVNACLSQVRRRRRRPFEVEIEPIYEPQVPDPAIGVADRALVDSILERLDERGRAVIVLHYLVGMSLPDVAVTLGIPLGTVKSRLHHALEAMRAEVAAHPTSATLTSEGNLA